MPSDTSQDDDRRKKECFWNGGRPDGDWGASENWGGQKPPTPDFDVYLYKASKKQGRVPFTPGTGTVVKNLTLDMTRTKDNPVPIVSGDWEGFGIGGDGITVVEKFHWRFGYIESTVKLRAGASVLIDNPPIGLLEGADSTPSVREMLLLDKVPPKRLHKPLLIPGLCEIKNTHLKLGGDGLLTVSGITSVSGSSRISGSMAKTCGLHVDGTMEVRSGTLHIDDVAFILRGSLTIAKGASVVLNAKTAAHLVALSGKVSGPGTLVIGGRLVVARGGKISRSTRVILDGGTVENLHGAQLSAAVVGEVTSQRFTVSGPMEWKAGTVRGDIAVEKTGSMVLHSDGKKEYVSGTLTNRGVVEIRDSSLTAVDGILDNRGEIDLVGDTDIGTAREFRLSNRGTITVAGAGRCTVGHFPFVNSGRVNVGVEGDDDTAELHLQHWGKSVFSQDKSGSLYICPGSVLRSDTPMVIDAGVIGSVDPKTADDPLDPLGSYTASAPSDATIVTSQLTVGRVVIPKGAATPKSPPMVIVPGGPITPGTLVIQGSIAMGDSATLLLRDYAPAGGTTACLKVTETGTMSGTLRIEIAGDIPDPDYVSSPIISAKSLGGRFTVLRFPRQGNTKMLPRVERNEVRLCVETGPGMRVDLQHAGSKEFIGESLADDHMFKTHKGECANGVQYVMARAFRPVGEVTGWKPGVKVRDSDVPPGTVIGSFKEDGRFDQTHAAILIRKTDKYLEVWDQFNNDTNDDGIDDFFKGWGVRELPYGYSGGNPHGNDGDYFYVVERK